MYLNTSVMADEGLGNQPHLTGITGWRDRVAAHASKGDRRSTEFYSTGHGVARRLFPCY